MKKGSKHVDRTKAKIRATLIIKHVEAFALGERIGRSKNPHQMTSAQLRAAEMLLARAEPILQRITYQGDADKPLYHRVERVIVRSPPKRD